MRLSDIEPKQQLNELAFDSDPLINAKAIYDELYPKVKQIVNDCSDRRPTDTSDDFGNLSEEDMMTKVKPKLDRLFQSFLNSHQQLKCIASMGDFDVRAPTAFHPDVDSNQTAAVTIAGAGGFAATICINYSFLYQMTQGEAYRMPLMIKEVLISFIHEYAHYRQYASKFLIDTTMYPGAVEDQKAMQATVAHLDPTNSVRTNMEGYIKKINYYGSYEEIDSYATGAAIEIIDRMYNDSTPIQQKTQRVRELMSQGPKKWAELCRTSESWTTYYMLYSVGATKLMKQFIRMVIRHLDYMDANHDPDRNGKLPKRPKLLPGPNPSFSVGPNKIQKIIPDQ